ncbi:sensor histidine kinase [Arabiibacter massiliensis]|uniref:sensor histidine kinase n=1 Tax=Arabiibacter massiliensis TaxID=1870985 RepID=UPI0009B9A888|nr:histidine kinase [Arabiibacter massiliensis]
MERIVDKAIVLACCLASFLVLPWSVALLVALLVAVGAAALGEVLPPRFASLPALAFALAALAWPAFVAFLPLAVYDLVRDDHPAVRACWALPLLAAFARLPFAASLLVVLVCAVSFLLSFRARRTQHELAAYRRLRDDVQETSLALEEKNRGLRERQDLEVRLATLAERGRIAREIHDNVGHLLTRSIMQVEALQVVHRDDEQVRAELAQVGGTLHEAMSTVRTSVHDLHDDAFDLETQIRDVARSCGALAVDVDFRADDVPADVGACFIAIVREALSNAARHGDATRASVSVASYPAFFRLVVHDNGTVAPPSDVLGDAPRARRGIGLSTMADRARALGGRCRIDFDHGFRVFVTVPKGDPA